MPPRSQRFTIQQQTGIFKTNTAFEKRVIVSFFFPPLRYEMLHSNKSNVTILYHPFIFPSDRFICSRKENRDFHLWAFPWPLLGFCKLRSSLAVNAPDWLGAPLALQLGSTETRSRWVGGTCSSAPTPQSTTAERGSWFSDTRLYTLLSRLHSWVNKLLAPVTIKLSLAIRSKIPWKANEVGNTFTMWNPRVDMSTDDPDASWGDYIKIRDKIYRSAGQIFPLQILSWKKSLNRRITRFLLQREKQYFWKRQFFCGYLPSV